MSYEVFDKDSDGSQNGAESDIQVDRLEDLSRIKEHSVCDVLVVGGGIHGAAFARFAALNGLRTILVERADFGGATSSRSSKLVHGGLRYLELFDFKQVWEGIKAREDWLQSAGHLVHPQRFFIPVHKDAKFLRLKMHLGLPLYDLFGSPTNRKHRWVSRDILDELRLPEFNDIAGGFLYFDGQMDDLRIVLENIMAARQEGAICLNYCSLKSFSQLSDNQVSCGVIDHRGGEEIELRAGVVVNCAGPWAPFAGRLGAASWRSQVRYSKGIHLLFSFEWNGPALLLPLGSYGRYYFVLPHPAGTLVGTTEKEVSDPVDDPVPEKTEVEELLARVQADIPQTRFSRENLHYAFAGLRTLAIKPGEKDTSKISRKHRWLYKDGMLSLIGGKYTTAYWTVSEGLQRIADLTGVQLNSEFRGRPLPGYGLFEESVENFRKAGAEDGIPGELVERLVGRYGSLVRHFLKDRPLKAIGEETLEQEIQFACQQESAETLEDLMRRRLNLEYWPGHGLKNLEAIAKVFSQFRPELDIEGEKQHYRDRMNSLAEILEKSAT